MDTQTGQACAVARVPPATLVAVRKMEKAKSSKGGQRTRAGSPSHPTQKKKKKKKKNTGGGGEASMGPKRRPHVTLCRQLLGVLARS